MLNQDLLTRAALGQLSGETISARAPQSFIEDIKKLKALPVYPEIAESEKDNYYVEPVTIEYYIPKESRFAQEVKYLYLELIDPQPRNDNQQKIRDYFVSQNEPIDIIKVMDIFPQFMGKILEYYNATMNLFESLSIMYRSGLQDEPIAIRNALYLNEVLRKKEPTVPSLEILGDYANFNINWCVRFLNRQRIPHTLEDRTVGHLIVLNKQKLSAAGQTDERFLTLSRIYLEQAFPLADLDLDEQAEFRPIFRV